MTMTERDFDAAADEALHRLEAAFEPVDDVEVDLESGILTLEFHDGTKFIVNSHRAARQIWMAAERTAWHFDPTEGGGWVAAKSGDELWSALSGVVSRKLGRAITLG